MRVGSYKKNKYKFGGTSTRFTNSFDTSYFTHKVDNEQIAMTTYIKGVSEIISNKVILQELQEMKYITYKDSLNERITDPKDRNIVNIIMQDIGYQVIANIGFREVVEIMSQKYITISQIIVGGLAGLIGGGLVLVVDKLLLS